MKAGDLAYKVCDLIETGRLDKYLVVMDESIRERRKRIRDKKPRVNLHKLKPGARVRITSGLRPRYLVGLKGEVKDRDEIPVMGREPSSKHIPVDMGRIVRRYGPIIWVPANCLEEVE
jgi:hypothetical protein